MSQRIADRSPQSCSQFLTAQHRDTGHNILAGNLHRTGDHDVAVIVRVVNVVHVVMVYRLRQRGRGSGCKRQGQAGSKQQLRIHRNSRSTAAAKGQPCA